MRSEYTYKELLDSKALCFRITRPDSAAQFDPEHGFTATHPICTDQNGRPKSSDDMRLFRQALWSSLSQIRESVENHVLGGWRNDSPSICISSSTDVNWILWEVVRILLVFEPAYVDVWIIRDNSLLRDSSQCPEGLVNRSSVQAMTVCEKKTKPFYFSRSSSERVHFGRIPRENVEGRLGFTATKLPLNMPESFFVPVENRAGGRWIDWLVWSPDDSFYSAMRKVETRASLIAAMVAFDAMTLAPPAFSTLSDIAHWSSSSSGSATVLPLTSDSDTILACSSSDDTDSSDSSDESSDSDDNSPKPPATVLRSLIGPYISIISLPCPYQICIESRN